MDTLYARLSDARIFTCTSGCYFVGAFLLEEDVYVVYRGTNRVDCLTTILSFVGTPAPRELRRDMMAGSYDPKPEDWESEHLLGSPKKEKI